MTLSAAPQHEHEHGHLSMNGDGQVSTWNRKARSMGTRHAPYSQVLWGDSRKHPDLGLWDRVSSIRCILVSAKPTWGPPYLWAEEALPHLDAIGSCWKIASSSLPNAPAA